MGSLAHFDLPGIVRMHGVKHFVETGTAQGDSLALAAAVKDFATLHSVEIMPDLVINARARFASDPRVQIWEGDSRSCLPMILRELPPEPCLFWLDAHFPGAHSGADYDAEKDAAVRLPLEEELRTIADARKGIADVLLLDDMRIYINRPKDAANLPDDFPGLSGIVRSDGPPQFVRDLYGAMHGFVVDFSDQWYGMVFPRR